MKIKTLIPLFLVMVMVLFSFTADAQCSICTRTAQQLGDKPAKSLNFGILYLAAAPLAICGFLGYRWYKRNGVH